MLASVWWGLCSAVLIHALLCHCLGYLVNMMCIYFTWPNEVHVERQSRVWTMAWMTLAIR